MTDSPEVDLRTARRLQARSIQQYLDVLNRPRSTMSRERLTMQKQKAEKALAAAEEKGNWLKVMEAIERLNAATRALETLDSSPSRTSLEYEFTRCARDYSERKGISYATWRYVGVPASVLKGAGIS